MNRNASIYEAVELVAIIQKFVLVSCKSAFISYNNIQGIHHQLDYSIVFSMKSSEYS